MLKLEI